MGASVNAVWHAALWLALASTWATAAFDPTAPPRTGTGVGTGVGTAQQAELAWVKLSGRQSVAWYGGSAVRLGDAVEGGRVSAIREDHIVISGRHGSRVVYLFDRAQRAARRP